VSTPLVPVLADKRARAWPRHAEGGTARYVSLAEALTKPYTTDAHFAAYSAPDLARRLDKGALAQRPEGVVMTLAIFDVDDAEAHAEARPSAPEWWTALQAQRAVLEARHPGSFVYRTRGGARIAYRLPSSIVLRAEVDAEAWKRLYSSWAGYLIETFGIAADLKCSDWTRLYRLPHATRDEGGQPEALPTLGNAHAIGAWAASCPSFADVQAEVEAEAQQRDRARQAAAAYAGAPVHLNGSASPRAKTAHETEMGRVAGAAQNTRNDTLNGAAFNLGQLHAAGELPDVLEDLVAAAMQAGLSEHEARATAQSGWDAGLTRPRAPSTRQQATRSNGHARAGTAAAVGLAEGAEMEQPGCEVPLDVLEDGAGHEDQEAEQPQKDARPENLTDLGNARVLVRLFSSRLRHVAGQGWFAWDGKRWRHDDTGAAMRAVKQAIKARWKEREAAKCEGDRDRADKLAKWLLQSESAQRNEAALKVASTERELVARIQDFDTDTMLLNVRNGTINLRLGELRPHRQEDRITKLAPVAFDPAAECPTWLAFLERVQPNPAVRAFLQRLAGYCATAETREQKVPIHFGLGANGKSVFDSTLLHVFGDYADTAAFDTFTERKGAGPRDDLADLRALRYVTASESNAGARLNEALVKQVTGGDPIRARKLYQDAFTFWPAFKVSLKSNHRPRIRGTDEGVWRRILLVPWSVRIPEAEQDKTLPERLKAEAAGILRWIVEGCLEWQRIGLAPPPEVLAATKDYRQREDTIQRFIDDRCLVLPGATVPAADLHGAYLRWAQGEGEPELSAKRIGAWLEDHGFSPVRIGSGDARRRAWNGLQLMRDRLDVSRRDFSPTGLHEGTFRKDTSHLSHTSRNPGED